MRFEVSFNCDSELRLPLHYNFLVQGMIYNHMSPELGRELHDMGYPYEKRKFKLFTFSRLTGAFRLEKDTEEIVFFPPIRLLISSPMERFIYELGYSMVTCEDLRLGENKVTIAGINVPPEPEFPSPALIEMLSPVTVYSTLKTADGRSKTYYYSPYEDEFSQLIESNLKKKYSIIHNREASEGRTLSVKPVRVNKRMEKILKYKGTVIKGWMGIYSIEGDPELIRIGYDAGLGSKNSQGFGCFRFIKAVGDRSLEEESSAISDDRLTDNKE